MLKGSCDGLNDHPLRIEERNMPVLLLVEDDYSLAEALRTLFDGEGFSVRYAQDGISALSEVAKGLPDIIVIDAMMPRLGGLGFIATLKARGIVIPIVLISANNVDPKQTGVRFVSKPFELDYLLSTVAGALADSDRYSRRMN